MLTIFSCPKSFTDPHINIIQRNAIKSWTLLNPQPEIILIGNDAGVKQICEELDLIHITDVNQNEYGTPLLDSIFEKTRQRASNQLLCYINADIILLSDFMKSISIVSNTLHPPFLVVGRRWDVEINEGIDFNEDWEDKIRYLAFHKGIMQPPSAIDYFVFTKDVYKTIPPFALGRTRWDNWLVWNPVSRGITVVDITEQNIIIHQNHDYAHIDKGYQLKSQRFINEKEQNERLVGKWWPLYLYTVWDSTHVLKNGKILYAPFYRKFDYTTERLMGVLSLAIRNYLPYTYPVYITGKVLAKTINFIRRLIHKKI